MNSKSNKSIDKNNNTINESIVKFNKLCQSLDSFVS
jgi:hypothetical protein